MSTNENIINEIISGIDWDKVSLLLNSTDVNYEKIKLRKRFQFILTTNLTELICDKWTIKYDIIKHEFQVHFIPITISANLISHSNELKINTKLDSKEFKTLHNMLQKAQLNEEYELCQIIKNRLEEIIIEMD